MNTAPPFDETTHFGGASGLPDVPQHLLKFPVEIKTFGILHWVIAFCGFICFVGGSTVIIFFSTLANQTPPGIPPEDRESIQSVAIFAESIAWIMWIQLACCSILTILLCIAGFGLLKARDYGRRMSQYYAVASIITKVVIGALSVIYIGPELQRMIERMESLAKEKGINTAGGDMGLLNTSINTLLFCVYPVLVLIFLHRKAVKDCLRGR
jgi:fumarate reductase subunit D